MGPIRCDNACELFLKHLLVQAWGWVVVTDPLIKAQIAASYREGWQAAYGRGGARKS